MRARRSPALAPSGVAAAGRWIGVMREGPIAVVVLDRAPINAVVAPVVHQLASVIGALDADAAVRAIVLTGAIRNAFCSGGDLGHLFGPEMRAATPVQRRDLALGLQFAFRAIEECSKPVVAAINGVAIGAGLELALVCDVRVASELAYFALPELRHHIIPGCGATLRLARHIGLGRAKEMLMLGRRVRADEALAWGLVQRVVPHREVVAAASAVATQLAAYPPHAFAAMKVSIHRGFAGDEETNLDTEAREFARLVDRRLAELMEGCDERLS